MLVGYFPEEREGIVGIFEDMRGLTNDINKYQSAGGKVDMSRFPADFPYLFKSFNKTWGQLQDTRLKDPKLKAIVSGLWGYFGLPPSKLASFYYAMPLIGYLHEGGYYPRGKSQKLSEAFVKFIEDHGGKVKLRSRVEKILVKDQTAYGVKTKDGAEYTAKVVVSNANAHDTFLKMLEGNKPLEDLKKRMDKLSISFSSFQVFLGLKKDLVSEIGIKDTEIFYYPDYDHEAGYKAALNADVESSGYGLTLYDNLYKEYSPEGKNIVNIIITQGYDHWIKYEADYWKGNKTEYKKEKERMADVLISQVEETLLLGLSEAIEVKEIGTPLTNIRYTSNTRGAIYGWDQTLDNTGPRRFPQTTPIKNLYLSGAWTSPGHGYTAVLMSGLQCFGEIMKSW
jgi:prolycopene isomerase